MDAMVVTGTMVGIVFFGIAALSFWTAGSTLYSSDLLDDPIITLPGAIMVSLIGIMVAAIGIAVMLQTFTAQPGILDR